MAAYTDYPQLTKYDKSRALSLKKSIFEVSRKLGSGVSSPVPYDTAWVARIPKINKSGPAFPESLQWLRDHQNADGSWGTDYPLSLHSKMLNTFAAVLAFSEWNFKDDADRIRRGSKAVEMIVKALPREETNEHVFEMIISGLLDDAREFKIDLAYEQFEWLSKVGKEKLKEIDREILSNEPNKYWSLLEAAGSKELELASYRKEITKYGLIAAQPSTTAFILRYARLRGQDFPEIEWVLKDLCTINQGGMPHLVPIDNFEISHGLDFLFKVNINPEINVKHAATQKAIDSLKWRLDSTNRIGFSSNWPIADGGCTTTASGVVRSISHDCRTQPDNIEIKNSKLTKSSLSFDLPDFFQNHLKSQKFDSMRQQGITLEEDRSYTHRAVQCLNKTYMQGTQNVSPYYALLQYVFATPKQVPETLTAIEHLIGKNQNSDGGWGDKNPSSAEETAYVSLVIFRLIQTNKGVLNRIDFPKLVKFLNTVGSFPTNESFWCYKVMFGSAVLTETIMTAAKYGVFQIQRLCMYTDVLNDYKIDLMDATFLSAKDELIYQGIFPLVRPEVRRQDIEVSQTDIENNIKRILQTDCIDPYINKLIEYSLEFSYIFHDFKISPLDRAMDLLWHVFFFIFTDFLDFHLDEIKPTTDFVDSMQVVLKILRGGYQTSDTLPTFELPRLTFAWRWWFHVKELIEKNNWNVESFAKTIEKRIFNMYSIDYRLRCYGIKITSKRYLEISKVDVGLVEAVLFASLLQGSTVDITDFENNELFQKYVYYACKASRVISDVPSVFRDLSLSHSDNYCVTLMQDSGISVAEAMKKATKKAGKETMKMYSLKKMILARENKDNEKLVFLMENIERFHYTNIMWGIRTSRYHVGQKCTAKRVDHEEKDLAFTWNLCF